MIRILVASLALGFVNLAVAVESRDAVGLSTLDVTLGKTKFINVSSRMANELITPYQNPQLIKFIREQTDASISSSGSSIYVSTGSEEFVQLLIKNADAPAQPAISLVLLPAEDVEPQHIMLNPVGVAFGASKEDSDTKLGSANYVDMLRELIREAARDDVPQGYAKDPVWNGTKIQVGTVVGEPSKRLVGNTLAVEYFVLQNTGASRVELVEQNFKMPGVRAIAFINEVLLAPGQATRMVWVKDR